MTFLAREAAARQVHFRLHALCALDSEFHVAALFVHPPSHKANFDGFSPFSLGRKNLWMAENVAAAHATGEAESVNKK
jgi:hypothetical protein